MSPVTPETIIADVLAAGAPALRVFLGRGMACPGCPMARFMTLAEVAKAYGLDAADLVRELTDSSGASIAPDTQSQRQ